ncbi:hypothetical protein [Nonomuraea sediminis]|uniref:hypothetical protein n=1 Tax=Nonomuraea sediminis TaxID=2835864 RepID=UPI001BDD57E3|nr:hypothetical protein [Nonomuraea sediminis]
MKSLSIAAAVATSLVLAAGPVAAEPPTNLNRPVTIVSDQAGETFAESVNATEATGARDITWTSSSGRLKITARGLLPGSTVRVSHSASQASGSSKNPSAQMVSARGVGVAITGPAISKSELLRFAGSGPARPTDQAYSASTTPADNPTWSDSVDVTVGTGHVYAWYGYWLVNADGHGNWGILGQDWHSGRDDSSCCEITKIHQWSVFPRYNQIKDQDPKYTVDFPHCWDRNLSLNFFGFSLGGSIHNCRGKVNPWAWYNDTDSGVGVEWVGKSDYDTVGGAIDFAVYSPSGARWDMSDWLWVWDS